MTSAKAAVRGAPAKFTFTMKPPLVDGDDDVTITLTNDDGVFGYVPSPTITFTSLNSFEKLTIDVTPLSTALNSTYTINAILSTTSSSLLLLPGNSTTLLVRSYQSKVNCLPSLSCKGVHCQTKMIHV
jgi:hypothetical protein